MICEPIKSPFCWLKAKDIVIWNKEEHIVISVDESYKRVTVEETRNTRARRFTVKWSEVKKECRGVVTAWNKVLGYGLLWADDNEEYFAEKDDIVSKGFSALRINERVRFVSYWDRLPRAKKISNSKKRPIDYGEWDITIPANASRLPELQPEEGVRVQGVVQKWSDSRGRGWIAVHHKAPLYARCYDVKSKGRAQLQKDMLVEFEVRSQPEGGIYAAKITAPGNVPICIETGKARKHLLSTERIPEFQRFHIGVVKLWNGSRGVIRNIFDGANVVVLKENVNWASEAKNKALMSNDRVRYKLQTAEGNSKKINAVEVTHDNGLAYDIAYSRKRRRDAEKAPEACLAVEPPKGLNVLGPIRGIVKEWIVSNRCGVVVSELDERVYVHMGAIQCSDTKSIPALRVNDIVEFYLKSREGDNLVAFHVTLPYNVAYNETEKKQKSTLEQRLAGSSTKILEGEFTCSICNLCLSSQVTLDSHLAGKAHLKRLRELGNAKNENYDDGITYVDPCSQWFCGCCLWEGKSDEDFLNHIQTEEHLEQEDYYGSDPELDELPEDYMYRCRACDKKMATLDNWNKHIPGKKHRRMMDLSSMKYRECPLCKVVFTGRKHMQDHCRGRKHRELVKLNRGRDPIGDWKDWEKEQEDKKKRFRKNVRKMKRKIREAEGRSKKKRKVKNEVYSDDYYDDDDRGYEYL